MKFRCERDALADAVSTAQRAVASRAGALPVLSGIRVAAGADGLELVGSDLELTIRVTVSAQVDTPGNTVLPARLLSDLLHKLEPGVVQISVTGDDANLECGRFSTTLRTLSATDFPRVPEGAREGVRVHAGSLAEALRQVVPAASKDDARPILTGVLFTSTGSGLRLVATDSYRLAVRDLPGVTMLEEGQRVLVGAKGLAEVQRLIGDGEIEVCLAERDVTFRIGTVELTARLIEGDFPNYQQLIPTGYPNRLSVPRDQLTAALNRVRLVGQGRDSAPIRLAMSADSVELSAVAQDVGEAHESVEARFDGTELTAAFNSQFLLDGIEATGSGEVVLETIDPLKPAVLRSADSGEYLYLLMPVRIA